MKRQLPERKDREIPRRLGGDNQHVSRLLSTQVVVAEVKVGEADIVVDQAGQGYPRACLISFALYDRANPCEVRFVQQQLSRQHQ